MRASAGANVNLSCNALLGFSVVDAFGHVALDTVNFIVFHLYYFLSDSINPYKDGLSVLFLFVWIIFCLNVCYFLRIGRQDVFVCYRGFASFFVIG